MHEKPCIIITRPREDAEETAKFLALHGFDSFIEPVLTTQLIADAINRLKSIILHYDAVVVTSRNAVRAIVGFNSSIKIISLGKSTSSFAEEQGFTNVKYAGKNIEELCGYIKSEYADKKLVYASGELITKELTKENCGNNTHRIVLYRTIPVKDFSEEFKQKLINGNFSGIMFFSKKTSETFFEILKKEGLELYIKNIYAFCLSGNIGDSIENYGFRATVNTKNPNIDEIIKLVERFRF